MARGGLRVLLLAAGFLTLALGLIGIVLPVLPTTPFLLLTAFCFAKGSPRFHRWFAGTMLYRRYLGDYLRRGGMSRREKRRILLPVTALLLLTLLVTGHPLLRIVILLSLLAMHYCFRCRIPSTDDRAPLPLGERAVTMP